MELSIHAGEEEYLLHQYRRLVAVGCAIVVAACSSDSTSPETTSLDGAWSTGHTLVGFDMGISLTWTDKAVHGTGGYALANDSLACGTKNIAVPDNGSLTFTATRPTADHVTGSFQFENGASIPFDGAVIDSSRINGQFARIEGTIEGPDGTKCAWGLIHALVP